MRVVLSIGLALMVLYAGACAFGAWRWERQTQALVARLLAARRPPPARVVDLRSVDGLPAPVQRYLRAALRDGQPLVAAARVAHAGTFDASADGGAWKPFTSRQWIVTDRAGFVWDGRIAFAPGLAVRVHDAYVAGAGLLHPAALGLVGLGTQRDTPEVAQGELMRWLAEAPLVPTALLPGPGLAWHAVDERTADVTRVDGDISVTLRFAFGPDGMVDTVTAGARGRAVDGAVVPTPWRGRWWRYETHAGMRVPTEGEVGWVMPQGYRAYWRGRLVAAAYELAR